MKPDPGFLRLDIKEAIFERDVNYLLTMDPEY